MSRQQESSSRLKLASMAFGAFLLTAALVAAFMRETMSPAQVGLIRVISSLAAGLVAVGIAGYVTLKGSVAGLALKAGGPIAFAVLVYVVDPSSAAAEAGASPERKEATEEIKKLKAAIGDAEVTLVEDGHETKLKGPEAVKQIARTEANLDPSELSRSATKAEMDRIAEALRHARDSRRLVLRPRPPPPH
jgi:hypothetical protein